VTPDRRTLLALFSIAFGLRVLYAALVGTDPAFNPSPGTYEYFLADRIHDSMAWVKEPFTPRAPGYVLTLAAAFKVLGVRQWVAILMQAFFGGVTVLMLYRIGERRLGRGVGLLAALWLAISVHQMHFTSVFVRDTLVTLALVWFVYTMVRPFERMRQAIWAGVVYTFLIHVDPQFLLLLPVVLLYFLFFATRHRILSVQYLFLFLATVFVVSLPWTIRNAMVYGEAIPVGLEAKRYIRPVTALENPDTRVSEDDLKGTQALLAHSGGAWQNTVEFWRVTRLHSSQGTGVHTEPPWSLRHNFINIVLFGALLPFALVGLFMGWRRRRRAVLVLFMVTATYWLMHAFLGATERTRLPIEPFVILLAFYGLTELIAAARSRRDRGDSAPVGA
jgi:4-amino-4-deoxy-L-arabinose transferase-like glycosyltransferase